MAGKVSPRWPRSMAEVKRDPRVRDVSDERGMGDGVWIYLVAGYDNGSPETHAVSEDTVGEALAAFRGIRKCSCEDCAREIAAGTDETRSMKELAERRAAAAAAATPEAA